MKNCATLNLRHFAIFSGREKNPRFFPKSMTIFRFPWLDSKKQSGIDYYWVFFSFSANYWWNCKNRSLWDPIWGFFALFLTEIRKFFAKFPFFSAQISDTILSSSENSLKTGVGHILNPICFWKLWIYSLWETKHIFVPYPGFFRKLWNLWTDHTDKSDVFHRFSW